MKNKLYVGAAIAALSFGLLTAPSVAEAYTQCRWVSGHWEYGYWVPAHKVCWQTYRSRGYYYRDGYYYRNHPRYYYYNR